MPVTFRRLDVLIAQPGLPPVETARVLVCWEIVPLHTGLDEVVFTVERSLSPAFPEHEVEVVSSPIAGVAGQWVYTFVDLTPSLLHLWRRYFYRVRATRGEGVVTSPIRSWEKSPRTYELAIIERHDWLLENEVGAPSYVFLERTADSAPCSCVDRTAGRPTRSHCSVCLGTGRQRPYLDPIFVNVSYDPGEKVTQVAQIELQVHQRACWLSAFPIVKPGDLLWRLGGGELYRIAKVGPQPEPQGVTLLQIAALDALDRKDAVYQLIKQVSDAELVAVLDRWDRIREERRF